jgi:hypothetical protein
MLGLGQTLHRRAVTKRPCRRVYIRAMSVVQCKPGNSCTDESWARISLLLQCNHCRAQSAVAAKGFNGSRVQFTSNKLNNRIKET